MWCLGSWTRTPDGEKHRLCAYDTCDENNRQLCVHIAQSEDWVVGVVVIEAEEGYPNHLTSPVPKAIMQFNCLGTTPRPDRCCEKCPSRERCLDLVGCVIVLEIS